MANNTLVVLFFVCLVFSVWSNSSTKLLMKSFSFPITVTLAHFLISAVVGWAFSIAISQISKKNAPTSRPDESDFVVDLASRKVKASKGVWLKNMMPLALCYTVGFLSTNISFQLVELSFSLTIKSAEPLCTALLSWILMGDTYPLPVYASLMTIVLGVILASAAEISFTLIGFVCAWMSNFALASRSVLNKMVQTAQKQEAQNQQEHVAVIEGDQNTASAMMWAQIKIDVDVLTECNLIAFILTLPLFFLLEFQEVSEVLGSIEAEEYDRLLMLTVVSGVLFQMYNMFSLMILSITSPLTHVVAQSVRRVIVIIFSVVYFGNRVTPLNWAGTMVVFAAVFWYNYLVSPPSRSSRVPSASSEKSPPPAKPSVLRAQNLI